MSVVISLTTISSRLDLLKKVIVSLFEQSVKPDIIHVFYSTTPLFYDLGITHQQIREIESELQLVNVCHIQLIFTPTENIGSYRKLIPALKIYHNHIVITVDDDHEHEQNFIAKYLDIYQTYSCIVCSGGKVVNFNNLIDSEFSPDYINPTQKPLMNLLPEGFGGILYHTRMFDSDFINYNYQDLPETILKNDDLFFRLYTYHKGIKVMAININKHHLLTESGLRPSLFTNYNSKLNVIEVLQQINQLDLMRSIQTSDQLSTETLEWVEETNIINLFKGRVGTGTDIKQLQYELFANDRCNHQIDFRSCFKSGGECLLLVINLEHDTQRYLSVIDEIQKLSLTTFVHLKGTYWKHKNQLTTDLTEILRFMQPFNLQIQSTDININAFSEINDPKIEIQDGPLACYCSHVRALKYGYENQRGLTYIIIAEDDILVANTGKIEQYLRQVPDDWDIIGLNLCPLNRIYSEPMYKLTDLFHSTHMYIVHPRCLPVLFQNLYPITDQVDILIAKLHSRLNIYNIVDTVYQKNFSTNTQNNLYVIFNSPGYLNIRNYLDEFKFLLKTQICQKLDQIDPKISQYLVSNIMFDVVYNYIVNTQSNFTSDLNLTLPPIISPTDRLYQLLYIIVNCCVKGIDIQTTTLSLLNDISAIIECFQLHQPNGQIHAYSYGSTSNTYLETINNQVSVIKVYNQKLRWSRVNHDMVDLIFNREVMILKILKGMSYVPQMIDYNLTQKQIRMSYQGLSLYHEFNLPNNWQQQIVDIFDNFSQRNIDYFEFNLKNIVVLNDQLSIVDFGMARMLTTLINPHLNDHNCNVWIELLTELSHKFQAIHEPEQRYVLYTTYMNNLRREKLYEGHIF